MKAKTSPTPPPPLYWGRRRVVPMHLWAPEVAFGSFFEGSGWPNVEKDIETEAFLREAVGASEGGF